MDHAAPLPHRSLTPWITWLVLLVWLCVGCVTAQGQAPVAPVPLRTPPPGGASILAADALRSGALDQHQEGPAPSVLPDDHSTIEHFSVQNQPFPEVLRLVCKHPQAMSYHAQYLLPVSQPVKKGARLLVAFYARGVRSEHETGEALLHIYVQKKSGGYPHTFDFRVSLPVKEEYTYFQLPFAAEFDLEPGDGEVGLGFGAQKPQELEVGGLQVLDYGPQADLSQATVSGSTYAGREADAPWRAVADQRIEQNRKAALTVLVLDAADKPVTDARVEVEMTRHQFAFGSAVSAKHLLAQGPDGDRYRATVEELFNTVTLENDLKWGPWEVAEGHDTFSRAQTLAALRWLKDRNIRVRGHVMVWPSWKHTPERLRALENDPVGLQAAVLGHIRELSAATKGWVDEWDVVNEPYDNHALMEIAGDYAMVQWYRTAREANPEIPLFINDYGILSGGGRDQRHQDHYAAVIQYLLDQGAPLQGIGMQGHFGWDLTPPERLLAILDRFAKFGKPLVITEYDCAVTDERLQADYMRDFMTLIFSHPAVAGFVQWGFWDGRHWKPGAPMFRQDWSPRPSAEVFRELVQRNWWTRDGGPTDAQGLYETRGFLGEYTVTVSRGQSMQKTTATLKPIGTRVTVMLP